MDADCGGGSVSQQTPQVVGLRGVNQQYPTRLLDPLVDPTHTRAGQQIQVF
jgi:hypothetical protein